jgi:hypothetical protein
MYHTHTITADRLARYAAALGAYAATDPTFAKRIAGYLTSLETASITPPSITASPYALPPSDEIALSRLTWLMSQLATKPRHETEAAIAVLQAATRHVENPKALVIGIIGFAVTFIDLGIIKKKKKRQALRIVVENSIIAKSTRSELISLTQTASGAFVAQELRAVFGNAHELEPDLAEWLFTDNETKIFEASTHELNELAALLHTESLPHTVIRGEDDSISAIALSPAIADSLEVGTELTA